MKGTIRFPQGTKFLVTGGAGFVGSSICEALVNEGYFVRCLDDFSTGKLENIEYLLGKSNFQLIRGDIRSYETCAEACSGMDFVSHQAAWGSVPRSMKLPRAYESVNVTGTLNMLEAARKAGVAKFVYASSSSVYGDEPQLPKREGQEGAPLSPYALTKKFNEEYASLYFRIYGLETVGLRYFNVFGRRQDPEGPYAAVIPRFVQMLLKGESPVIHGDGRQSRDFTYIDNVVQANFRAMKSGSESSGKVFNIACGKRVELLELYNLLCRMLGSDIAPTYSASREGDIRHSTADISKAKAVLGYDPEYDFETGLSQAIKWYESNLK